MDGGGGEYKAITTVTDTVRHNPRQTDPDPDPDTDTDTDTYTDTDRH